MAASGLDARLGAVLDQVRELLTIRPMPDSENCARSQNQVDKML